MIGKILIKYSHQNKIIICNDSDKFNLGPHTSSSLSTAGAGIILGSGKGTRCGFG